MKTITKEQIAPDLPGDGVVIPQTLARDNYSRIAPLESSLRQFLPHFAKVWLQ